MRLAIHSLSFLFVLLMLGLSGCNSQDNSGAGEPLPVKELPSPKPPSNCQQKRTCELFVLNYGKEELSQLWKYTQNLEFENTSQGTYKDKELRAAVLLGLSSHRLLKENFSGHPGEVEAYRILKVLIFDENNQIYPSLPVQRIEQFQNIITDFFKEYL